MYPILFSIGSIHFYGYGLLMVLGFVFGHQVVTRQFRRQGLKPARLKAILVISVISAVAGSHFLDVLMELLRTGHVPPTVWQIGTGLTEMGGMLTGSLGVYLYLRFNGDKPLPYLDSLALAVPLGLSFGRIGCFLAGCCYGKPTDLPWAITYADPHSFARPILGVPVHPTPIYMGLAMIALFAWLWRLARRDPAPGTLSAYFWIGYAAIRFSQEFLRADTVNPGGGLTVYQWLCLGILAVVVPATFRRQAVGAVEKA
jgi:phosphatidylglycerol:prolipoprotein diacylglycerol transferase